MHLPFAVELGFAYVFGGVPFGWLAVRVFLGKDVRKLGSGNIGATNVARVSSPKLRLPVFSAVYALDFAKGWLPVFLFAGGHPALGAASQLGALLGFCAVAGHCYSPFLRFKGGKGVATTCGVLCALDPIALVAAVVVFGLVLAYSRVVAVGSMALGLTLALVVVLRDVDTAFDDRWGVSLLSIFLAVFLFWTHRGNLRSLDRLRKQREASR